MKTKKYLEKFQGSKIYDYLLSEEFLLVKKDNIYHIGREVNVDENNHYNYCYPDLPVKQLITTDSELCDICFSNQELATFFEDDKLKDAAQAFLHLKAWGFSADSELILSKINSLKDITTLALEFEYSLNDLFDDDAQAYFILKDIDPNSAELLTKNMNKLISEVHKSTLGSDKCISILIDTLNLSPTDKRYSHLDDEFRKINLKESFFGESFFAVSNINRLPDSFLGREINYSDPKVIVWTLLAVLDHKAINEIKLVKIPAIFYNYIKDSYPEAIISKAYKKLDEETLSVANKLWTPYYEGTYHNFDDAYLAAELI